MSESNKPESNPTDDVSVASSASSRTTEQHKEDFSTSRSSSKPSGKAINEPPPVVVNKETRDVYCAKLVMIGVLSMTAVASAMATYLFTSNEVDSAFQHSVRFYSVFFVCNRVANKELTCLHRFVLFTFQFRDLATEIIDVSQTSAENLFQSFESLSIGLTSFADGTDEIWPFVTLPIFEAQVGNLRDTLDADWVSVVPFVDNRDRKAWEDYSISTQGWIREGMDMVNKKRRLAEVTPYIFRRYANGTEYVDNVPPNPYYAPMWQTTPPSQAEVNVNYNAFDNQELASLIKQIFNSSSAALSQAVNITGHSNSSITWPRSYFAQPVFDKVGKGGKLVAVVAASFPWSSFVDNILRTGENGLVLVMRYSCEGKKGPSQEFTFQINGPTAVYMGAGDLHAAPRWTSNEFASNVPAFRASGNCSYSMHIFPSDEFHSAYVSNRPAVYTSIVVLIFLITALVFTWYDCSVDRRQDKVVSTAAKTNAIVDSFFPSHVRDRLMRGEDDDLAGTGEKLSTPAAFGKVFGNEVLATKPIADLFPHATVMFADIVGFTAWSSVREPAQVFELLENVYNSFDKIAKRRRFVMIHDLLRRYLVDMCLTNFTSLPQSFQGRNNRRLLCRSIRNSGSSRGSCRHNGSLRSRLFI